MPFFVGRRAEIKRSNKKRHSLSGGEEVGAARRNYIIGGASYKYLFLISSSSTYCRQREDKPFFVPAKEN